MTATQTIEQAETVLKDSGLFTAINRRNIGATKYDVLPPYCLQPYFRARECQSVYSVEDAEKVVKEIQDRLAPMKVGDGAAVAFYSDIHACTVIAVSKDGKKITVQADKATLLNGFKSGEPDALQFSPGGFCGHTSGTQRYAFEANPEGKTYEFSLRLNGEWRAKGKSMNGTGTRLIKRRTHHYDYNF